MLQKLKPSYGVPWLEVSQCSSIYNQIEKEYFARTFEMKQLATSTLLEARAYELPVRVLPFGNTNADVLFILKGGMPVDMKTTIPFSDTPGYIIRAMLDYLKYPLSSCYTVTVTPFLEEEKIDKDDLLEYVAHFAIPAITALKPKVIVVFSELIGRSLSDLLGCHIAFRDRTEYNYEPDAYKTHIVTTYSPMHLISKGTAGGNVDALAIKGAIWDDLMKSFSLLKR